MKKTTSPENLIPMDIFIGREPVKIDLVYAQKDHPHNIFKTDLYHANARLWAHKDVATILLLAARALNKNYNYTIEIQDCLRTVDTQRKMHKTDIVKAHPEWAQEPNRLLAPPGAGGHPHALAVDLRLLNKEGQEVDMGTTFDTMTEQSHRNYTGFSEEILNNRQILEEAFVQSAKKLNHLFIPLPSEWWDFRFTHERTRQIEPLEDADLPPQMQMTNKIDNNIPNFDQEHFDKLAEDIITIVDENI